jgi:protein-L-isoaspartate O-methyltransferase
MNMHHGGHPGKPIHARASGVGSGMVRSLVRRLVWGLCGVAASAACVAAWAPQERHPVSGRVIAQTMSVAGAPWLERSERESEEQPTRAIQALRLRQGMVVADLGAGSGYYTVRLSRSVGRSGRVYATDVQPGMVDLLRQRVEKDRLSNVTVVQGALHDPQLPAGALDMVLMVDVYHELSAPQAFMQKIRAALKPDGRLVLIEFRGEDPNVPIQPLHKMTVAQIRQELGADGFDIDRVIDVLPWQHIVTLKPRQAP